jgi:methylglutaconyl-CoA hydratase
VSDAILLEPVDGRGVARVTLNRPAIHNAFDEALISALIDAFGHLGRDPTVRVILIAAAGRSFCAGADIAWMRRAAAQDEAANLEDARRFARLMQGIY